MWSHEYSVVCAFTLNQPFFLSLSPLTLKFLKLPFTAQIICLPAGLGTWGVCCTPFPSSISASGSHRVSPVCLCSCICAAAVLARGSASCPPTGVTFLSTHCAESLSHVQLCATIKTGARQAPLSIKYSQQDTGVGCHFLLQVIFLTQARTPCLLRWQAGSFPLCHLGSPKILTTQSLIRVFFYAANQ